MSGKDRRYRRKTDRTGRNPFGPGFVMLPHFLLDSEAYRDLRPVPRAIYIALKRLYNGRNNGVLFASCRDLARDVRCGKDTALSALIDLEEHGFIRCAMKGSFNYKVRHASEWILTEHDHNGEPATKDFLRWKPKEKCSP